MFKCWPSGNPKKTTNEMQRKGKENVEQGLKEMWSMWLK